MQTFKKGKINLDKTIALSKQIVKGEIEPSEVLEITTFCGEPVSFNFKTFKAEHRFPIEHIGLAQLLYEKAVDQFTTTVSHGKNEEKVFEVLPQGVHVSDVFQQCDPDIFTWYKSKSDNSTPLKFSTRFDGTFVNQDLNKFEKSLKFETEGENPCTVINDRNKIASLAVCEAIDAYEKGLAEMGMGERTGYVTEVTIDEASALFCNMKLLREKTFAEYGTSSNFEAVSSVQNQTDDCVQ